MGHNSLEKLSKL